MEKRSQTSRKAVDWSSRPDRQKAILVAAEKLFAERGYHAVTIRQIAEEAGVQVALVDYYFGQKHELFQAIFQHWRGTLDERLRMLDESLQGASGAQILRRVVEAFVLPVLQLRSSDEGEFYAQLVARELSHHTPEAEQVLADHFDPMALAFIEAFHTACPGSTRSDVAWAYQFAVGALLHHISDRRVERLSQGLNKAADPAAGQRLVNFICAGVSAVLTGEPPVHPDNH